MRHTPAHAHPLDAPPRQQSPLRSRNEREFFLEAAGRAPSARRTGASFERRRARCPPSLHSRTPSTVVGSPRAAAASRQPPGRRGCHCMYAAKFKVSPFFAERSLFSLTTPALSPDCCSRLRWYMVLAGKKKPDMAMVRVQIQNFIGDFAQQSCTVVERVVEPRPHTPLACLASHSLGCHWLRIARPLIRRTTSQTDWCRLPEHWSVPRDSADATP